jgi:hypothetical protein
MTCRARSAALPARAATLLLCLLSAACATIEPAPPTPPVEAVAAFQLPNDPAQPPWVRVPIRFKTETVYRADVVQGVPCIRAESDTSWSILAAPVPAAFANASTLSWRWITDALPPNATGQGMGRDDASVRVLIAFKGDMEKVPAADRAAMNMARLVGGWQIPYASIQYLWEARLPAETPLDHHTVSRIKKLVVRSGPEGLGQWLAFERDVRADFRRLFPGEEPGEIESIGIMTDTETMGGKASACYADITLR